MAKRRQHFYEYNHSQFALGVASGNNHGIQKDDKEHNKPTQLKKNKKKNEMQTAVKKIHVRTLDEEEMLLDNYLCSKKKLLWLSL